MQHAIRDNYYTQTVTMPQILKSCFAALVFTLFFQSAFSQTLTDSIAGEYHLQDVMETSSAVLLKADSTFEIFFSYGSIDRKGSGKWQFREGKIILNSKPKPEKDLRLISGKVKSGDQTIIRIKHPNKRILEHFEVLAKSPDGDQFGKSDVKGFIKLPKVKASQIELFFNFTPERFSSFQVRPEENYFEFEVEPWMMEIFVKDMILTVDENGLSGGHPLLRGNALSYEKVN